MNEVKQKMVKNIENFVGKEEASTAFGWDAFIVELMIPNSFF